MAKKEPQQQEHCQRMMNRDGEFSDDMMSQLPQDVIHDILTLLPTKDAAKTALLSKQWRRHWRTIPELVFDDGFERITEPSASSKFILNVYSTLLVHDGPVNVLVLAVPGLTPCDEIDHIVHHVSDKGVQEFTLELCGEHGGRAYYMLPSSLFTALGLKDLELKGCLFMVPPWFVRFNELTSLVLTDVSLPSDFFEQFLPKCPLLEWLVLYECEGLGQELELDFPRLQKFYFVGDLLKICFKHVPLLSELQLCAFGLQELDFVALFASLPLLEEMFIGTELLVVLGRGVDVPSRLQSPLLLHRLRTLHVSYRLSESSMEEQVLVCLIMSSPNLETLTIKIMEDMRPIDDQLLPAAATTSVGSLLEAAERRRGDGACLQHLKVVQFEDSVGAPMELELVRFVLATARQLLRVQIKPSMRLCCRKITKFMKEVLRYKRVSEAELIWNDEDENENENEDEDEEEA